MNSTTDTFLNELSKFFPNRQRSHTGRPPIPTDVILFEIYRLLKFNCGWRNIKHKTVCYYYFKEIQRRGLLQKFLNLQTTDLKKFRPSKTIVDSSNIDSYRVNKQVKYSGKYHNYCLKMTLEVTEDLVPLTWSIDPGSSSDSKVLDKLLQKQEKLPYEMYLDKGYERYDRRRGLQKQNCQVRMEMKKSKNRKKGKRYQLTEEHKKIRYSIEKVYAWLKSFMCLRLNRLRTKSLITAAFLFVLNYYAYYRLSL